MATFYNQATLSYGNNITTSNITTGELISGLTVTKAVASSGYGVGEGVTYLVSLVNATATDRTGITLTDDLGAYTVGTVNAVPLTYVDGSIIYYVNGVAQTAPTVTSGTELTITGINIPAGGNATIVYEATANNSAPLTAGSTITNTVTVDEESATATVSVRETVELSIAKAVCPAVVNDNGQLTYTFIIQNTGNLDATDTDNVVITDTFNPILNGITVTLNGTALTLGTDYTYDETTGEFATVAGAITVPSATYTQNSDTGVITATPGVSVLTVSGTV